MLGLDLNDDLLKTNEISTIGFPQGMVLILIFNLV